jgi:hypothetical protein
VICLDALVLPLDERSNVSRQALLERCFISSLRGIFATLAFDEHRVFAHAGDGGLYVGPGAMHRAAYGASLCWLTAETTNLGFQFCRAIGAAPRRCLEQRLEVRGPNPFGTCAEALFSIAAYFKQIVSF